MYGSHLLSGSLDYCFDFESHLAQKVYYTERTSVKLNMFYLHAYFQWHLLTLSRTAQASFSASSLLKPKSLDLLLCRTLARDNVFIYCSGSGDGDFDEQVHEELKR